MNWQTFSHLAFAFRVTPVLLGIGVLFALLMGLVGRRSAGDSSCEAAGGSGIARAVELPARLRFLLNPLWFTSSENGLVAVRSVY